jgi:hypothetical protein
MPSTKKALASPAKIPGGRQTVPLQKRRLGRKRKCLFILKVLPIGLLQLFGSDFLGGSLNFTWEDTKCDKNGIQHESVNK